MRTYKKWLKIFKRRYQLIIRNIENFAEYITIPFSYADITVAILTWLSISFGSSLWLAKTALAKWMNPSYIETKNQEKIISLAYTIEKLEQQIETQTQFITTLQNTIQYKSHSPNEFQTNNQLKQEEQSYTPSMATTESSIRNESQKPTKQIGSVSKVTTSNSKPNSKNMGNIENYVDTPNRSTEHNQLLGEKTTDRAATNNYSAKASTRSTLLLFPPIQGMITNPFDQKNNHYAIDIVAKEKDPIKAIAAGVIIFAEWSVDTGWVIIIQHHNNWVSICKHCAILFKKVGNLVKAGDVIALMGNSGELSKGAHLHFELWHKGTPLNPEIFINF